jgi:symplekin
MFFQWRHSHARAPHAAEKFFFFRYTDPISHHRCSNRNYRQQWDVLNSAKSRILEILYAQHTLAGVRIAAIKFMQKVILVQTRGATDPRVRPPPSGTAGSPVNGFIMIWYRYEPSFHFFSFPLSQLQNKNDPNLSLCPPDHPFIPVQALEAEGMKLLEGIITLFAQGMGDLRFMANNVDFLSAILNSMGNLVKLRPAFASWIVLTLSKWTPASLAGLPASSIRSVEKAIRILLYNISR